MPEDHDLSWGCSRQSRSACCKSQGPPSKVSPVCTGTGKKRRAADVVIRHSCTVVATQRGTAASTEALHELAREVPRLILQDGNSKPSASPAGCVLGSG